VKAQITLVADTLTSEPHFDDRSDAARFGATGHAVLKRVSGK
jgi:hypothetical protein